MKASNVDDALKMVKAMKAAKAAKATKLVKKAPKVYTSLDEVPMSKASRVNFQAVLNALSEEERAAVLPELLKNENFLKMYGDGFVNATPIRASSTINSIRRKLGFTGSYANKAQYSDQTKQSMRSGFKQMTTEVPDATRYTTGIKRTTGLHPDN